MCFSESFDPPSVAMRSDDETVGLNWKRSCFWFRNKFILRLSVCGNCISMQSQYILPDWDRSESRSTPKCDRNPDQVGLSSAFCYTGNCVCSGIGSLSVNVFHYSWFRKAQRSFRSHHVKRQLDGDASHGPYHNNDITSNLWLSRLSRNTEDRGNPTSNCDRR
jgi:hypothetical protein